MSIFTGGELEFLAGLNKSWWRLYWKELSRLRRIAAKDPAATVPAAAPEMRECGADPACPSRRRNAADAAAREALPRRVELVAGNR